MAWILVAALALAAAPCRGLAPTPLEPTPTAFPLPVAALVEGGAFLLARPLGRARLRPWSGCLYP